MRSCSDRSNIVVVMLGDVIQVRLCGHLDRAATTTLIGIIGAAARSGPMVSVDLDRACAPSTFVPPEPCALGSCSVQPEPRVVGPGVIRLQSASVSWTIDTRGRRLFRSDIPIDHRFVDRQHWLGVGQMWVAPGSTTVSLDDGSLLSIATSWSPSHDVETATRSGRDSARRRAA